MMSSCGTKPSTLRNVRRLAYRSAPSKQTDPEVAGATPAIASSNVVLPAPLPPTMATSSPGATLNDAASSNVSSRRSFVLTVRVNAWTSMRTPAWRSLGIVATACPWSVIGQSIARPVVAARRCRPGARRPLRADETADGGHTVHAVAFTRSLAFFVFAVVRSALPFASSRASARRPKRAAVMELHAIVERLRLHGGTRSSRSLLQ